MEVDASALELQTRADALRGSGNKGSIIIGGMLQQSLNDTLAQALKEPLDDDTRPTAPTSGSGTSERRSNPHVQGDGGSKISPDGLKGTLPDDVNRDGPIDETPGEI